MIRAFVRDLAEWGVGTAWWNFRFELGYKIGGFTHAKRWVGDDDPDGVIASCGMHE